MTEQQNDERVDRLHAEGTKAFADGITSTDCPYPTGEEWVCWLEGWDQAALKKAYG